MCPARLKLQLQLAANRMAQKAMNRWNAEGTQSVEKAVVDGITDEGKGRAQRSCSFRRSGPLSDLFSPGPFAFAQPQAAELGVADLCVKFQGLSAISNVDLKLSRSVIFGLIGPNGAGKTTLVICLTGFQQPTTGRVLLAGEDTAGRSIFAKRASPTGTMSPRERVRWSAFRLLSAHGFRSPS